MQKLQYFDIYDYSLALGALSDTNLSPTVEKHLECLGKSGKTRKNAEYFNHCSPPKNPLSIQI